MPNLIFDWQTPKNGQVAMKQLVSKGEMDSRDASKIAKNGYLYFFRVDNSLDSPNTHYMQEQI